MIANTNEKEVNLSKLQNETKTQTLKQESSEFITNEEDLTYESILNDYYDNEKEKKPRKSIDMLAEVEEMERLLAEWEDIEKEIQSNLIMSFIDGNHESTDLEVKVDIKEEKKDLEHDDSEVFLIENFTIEEEEVVKEENVYGSEKQIEAADLSSSEKSEAQLEIDTKTELGIEEEKETVEEEANEEKIITEEDVESYPEITKEINLEKNDDNDQIIGNLESSDIENNLVNEPVKEVLTIFSKDSIPKPKQKDLIEIYCENLKYRKESLKDNKKDEKVLKEKKKEILSKVTEDLNKEEEKHEIIDELIPGENQKETSVKMEIMIESSPQTKSIKQKQKHFNEKHQKLKQEKEEINSEKQKILDIAKKEKLLWAEKQLQENLLKTLEPKSKDRLLSPSKRLKSPSKQTGNSNKSLIKNALITILTGRVYDPIRQHILNDLENSQESHFLVLLKNSRIHSYKALYALDTKLSLVYKVHGNGPLELHPGKHYKYFKFDSASRMFKMIPGRAMSIAVHALSEE